MQYNWYNNLIYDSCCGLSCLEQILLSIAYSETLQDNLSLVAILEKLSSQIISLAPQKYS